MTETANSEPVPCVSCGDSCSGQITVGEDSMNQTTDQTELYERLGEIEAEMDELAEEKEMILHQLREGRDDE